MAINLFPTRCGLCSGSGSRGAPCPQCAQQIQRRLETLVVAVRRESVSVAQGDSMDPLVT
jgi:hypothetical protein